jgi:hypothetical protein
VRNKGEATDVPIRRIASSSYTSMTTGSASRLRTRSNETKPGLPWIADHDYTDMTSLMAHMGVGEGAVDPPVSRTQPSPGSRRR